MGCGRTSTGPSPLCGLLNWGKHFNCGLLGKRSEKIPVAACTTPCTELIQEKPNKKSQRHHSAKLDFQRNSCISRKSSLFCVPQVGGSSCQHTDIPQWGRCVCSLTLPPAQGHRDTPDFLREKETSLLDALLFPCPLAPKDVQHPEAHPESHSEMFSALRVVFHSILSAAGGKISTRRN